MKFIENVEKDKFQNQIYLIKEFIFFIGGQNENVKKQITKY